MEIGKVKERHTAREGRQAGKEGKHGRRTGREVREGEQAGKAVKGDRQ
jgi:hypothetical protein